VQHADLALGVDGDRDESGAEALFEVRRVEEDERGGGGGGGGEEGKGEAEGGVLEREGDGCAFGYGMLFVCFFLGEEGCVYILEWRDVRR
jgi:hypothetical protein